MFDYYVESGLIYTFALCFQVCSVLFCHVIYVLYMDVLFVYCVRIYVYLYVYICMCVCVYVYIYIYICMYVCMYVCIYMYVHLCTYILMSMYVLVHTVICINVICFSCRYLGGCYLLVCHCYLGSISILF